MLDKLRQKIDKHFLQTGKRPGLGIIMAGENAASKIYVKNKIKAAGKTGFDIFFENVKDEKNLIRTIEKFNNDPAVHGYIVQLPLPPETDTNATLDRIDPEKDADGFHTNNLGKIMTGAADIFPATPWGIVKLLDFYGISVEGKHVVIAGRSRIVGRPLAAMLSGKYAFGNATVTCIHSRTKEPEKYIREADIFISAIGKPLHWTKDYFSRDTVIIDVGINLFRGKTVGDVHFEQIRDFVRAATPVPGGIGPLTVASLLENTWKLFLRQTEGIKS